VLFTGAFSTIEVMFRLKSIKMIMRSE